MTRVNTQSRFIELFGEPLHNTKHWAQQRLDSLGILERGVSKARPRNASYLMDGPYPLVQTGEVANCDTYITDYLATYSEAGLAQSKLWPSGTLCITIAANIAKTGILTFDACFPDSIVGFIPNQNVDIIYIYYWFKSVQSFLEDLAPSTAQKNINLGILSQMQVILPPLKEQKLFTSFVQQADKSKFNDFKSRFIEMFGGIQNGTQWPIKKLSNLCYLINGYAFKSSKYSNSGYSVIRIANVQKGYIDDSDRVCYPFELKSEFEDSILREGDILISLTGNVGRVGVVTKKLLPAALNQRVQGLRIKDEHVIDRGFLFNILNLDDFESLCVENSSGSAQLNLSTIWVREFPIICPSLDRQREFSAFANQADKSKYLS